MNKQKKNLIINLGIGGILISCLGVVASSINTQNTTDFSIIAQNYSDKNNERVLCNNVLSTGKKIQSNRYNVFNESEAIRTKLRNFVRIYGDFDYLISQWDSWMSSEQCKEYIRFITDILFIDGFLEQDDVYNYYVKMNPLDEELHLSYDKLRGAKFQLVGVKRNNQVSSTIISEVNCEDVFYPDSQCDFVSEKCLSWNVNITKTYTIKDILDLEKNNNAEFQRVFYQAIVLTPNFKGKLSNKFHLKINRSKTSIEDNQITFELWNNHGEEKFTRTYNCFRNYNIFCEPEEIEGKLDGFTRVYGELDYLISQWESWKTNEYCKEYSLIITNTLFVNGFCNADEFYNYHVEMAPLSAEQHLDYDQLTGAKFRLIGTKHNDSTSRKVLFEVEYKNIFHPDAQCEFVDERCLNWNRNIVTTYSVKDILDLEKNDNSAFQSIFYPAVILTPNAKGKLSNKFHLKINRSKTSIEDNQITFELWKDGQDIKNTKTYSCFRKYNVFHDAETIGSNLAKFACVYGCLEYLISQWESWKTNDDEQCKRYTQFITDLLFIDGFQDHDDTYNYHIKMSPLNSEQYLDYDQLTGAKFRLIGTKHNDSTSRKVLFEVEYKNIFHPDAQCRFIDKGFLSWNLNIVKTYSVKDILDLEKNDNSAFQSIFYPAVVLTPNAKGEIARKFYLKINTSETSVKNNQIVFELWRNNQYITSSQIYNCFKK